MTFSSDDAELVTRLKKGDVEAFDLLYSKYAGKLYKFGLKYLKSTSDSEELVQSVFLKIWENKKKLKMELSFNSFLFTIAYNDICKIFRKRNYLRKFVNDTLSQNPLMSLRIEEGIDYKSLLERVEQIINTIPERQKTIFKKSREEGKSSKEIASEFDLSPGTVDNYISEVIKHIRKSLQNEDLVILLLTLLFF